MISSVINPVNLINVSLYLIQNIKNSLNSKNLIFYFTIYRFYGFTFKELKTHLLLFNINNQMLLYTYDISGVSVPMAANSEHSHSDQTHSRLLNVIAEHLSWPNQPITTDCSLHPEIVTQILGT